ncbi:MAG TPA: hypothetical protein VFR99_09500 [Marmoricola sp.]|nr:hypothetical protein [Marmoricola sp.]
MSSTQGCYDATVHDAHDHQVNRRGKAVTVWCPGKVRCAVCRKLVYKTLVQPLGAVAGGDRSKPSGGWKCKPRCR